MNQRYHDYIRSAQWQLLRARLICRARGCCEACQREATLQAHHLTYAHFEAEKPEEMLLLCKACHEAVEEAKKKAIIPRSGPIADIRALTLQHCLPRTEKSKKPIYPLNPLEDTALQARIDRYVIQPGCRRGHLFGRLSEHFKEYRGRDLLTRALSDLRFPDEVERRCENDRDRERIANHEDIAMFVGSG